MALQVGDDIGRGRMGQEVVDGCRRLSQFHDYDVVKGDDELRAILHVYHHVRVCKFYALQFSQYHCALAVALVDSERWDIIGKATSCRPDSQCCRINDSFHKNRFVDNVCDDVFLLFSKIPFSPLSEIRIMSPQGSDKPAVCLEPANALHHWYLSPHTAFHLLSSDAV